MRFIGKKSVCGAALGLLLAFYLIRKRKAQGGHAADDNVSADYQSTDAPPVVAPESDTPSVSDSSDAGPNDASATNAAVPNEPTPSAPPDGAETSTHRKDFSEAAHTASLSSTTLDTPAPGAPPAVDSDARTNDSSDTEIDDVSAANPDISVYEKAFDPPPSPSETPSDSERISDTPPDTVKPRKPRRTRQASQSPQSQTQRRQSDKPPRMYRGRRIRTGEYYPALSQPTEKASLRCRETSDGWQIFVALPGGRQVVEAFQGEDALDLDDEIRLDRFEGVVSVRYEDDTVDRIQLADASMDRQLFFRMRRNWEGEGRLVGKPSAGYIVAIAPRDYADEWDDVEASIEPEDCVDRNFQARFLFLKGTPLGAITQMRLEGTTLCDDSDIAHHGELYISAPPKLSVDPRIGVAVIVEETGVRAYNKWVQDFQPHNQSIRSALDGREGRFSVRTYQDGTLHESKPFRYFPNLRRITFDGQPYTTDANMVAFPDKGDGTHQAIELRFVSDNDDLLRPTSATATSAGVDEPGELQITGAGIVTVPPLPSIEAVECEFDNRASIALAMPRVWWRKTDEDGAGGDWSGAVFSIPRNEFASLLRTRLEIKTPPWVRSVFMGFGDRTDAEVPAVQGKASVELIAFANVEELEGTLGEDLFLNIRINGQSAPIIRVLADPVSYADGDYHMIEIRRAADDWLVCLARRSVDVNEGDIYKVKTRKGKGAVIDGMVDKIRPQSIKNNPKVIDVTI